MDTAASTRDPDIHTYICLAYLCIHAPVAVPSTGSLGNGCPEHSKARHSAWLRGRQTCPSSNFIIIKN